MACIASACQLLPKTLRAAAERPVTLQCSPPACALQAETAYTKSVLRDTEDLQEQLYKEMRGRIQEADQGVPQR